ncbi:MAG: hypothetical protein C4586_03730 [Anaerolineaceae bacterium]|nr:MAG: hypothetical protein C4586_03730 [Anaerolineaceae bacterium]
MTDELPDNTDNHSLTPKQSRAIGYLLTCRTAGDAAKKSGVSEKTIFTWMKLDNFRAALRDASRESIDNASRRLMQGQGEALDSLSALMTKGRNESVRRAAAVDWLNLMLKYKDLNDVEERLSKLEGVIYANEKK